MELGAHVGGRPGIDCGGFCEFCFYKNVNFNQLEELSIGCVNCPPNQIGCEYCQELVNRLRNDFKPLHIVLAELENKLSMYNLWGSSNENPKIVVGAGADIFYYPHIIELVSVLKKSHLSLHLGYTSGKAINDENLALELISLGLDELSFSAFSTDPEMRRKWMRDKNPEESIKSLKLFCQNIDVNASAVVIPEVNDEEQIIETCSDLEEWGVKSFVLRRFANFKNQGLILNNNKPVLNGVKTHSYEEFQELVKKINDEFSFQVLSFPFYSPKIDFPFAILKQENRNYLERLPEINCEATIITGKLAGPFLKEYFTNINDGGLVNVVPLDKDIADLITHDDLKDIDLAEVKNKVIIPHGALVQDKQAEEILSKDGVPKKLIRGPQVLTHPYYEGVDFNRDELIEYELKAFKDLINKINE